MASVFSRFPARSALLICLFSSALAACTHIEAPVPAGAIPNTDIFIADMSTTGENLWIGQLHPAAISEGYENQPYFTSDGLMLIYTGAGASGKTDIWARTLSTGTAHRLTQTPTKSEYSPRLKSDGATLSFIQEDETGEITELYEQTLGENNASAAVTLKPLGYYAHLRGGKDILTFLRSDPPTLVHIDPVQNETRQIASNIGRALYAAPDGQSAYYTIETSDDNFNIHQYDAESGESRLLFALPDGVQDYAVFAIPGTDLTGFFAASGTSLLFRIDHPESDWVPIADFSDAPFTDISRISVNDTATRIALVTETKSDDPNEN